MAQGAGKTLAATCRLMGPSCLCAILLGTEIKEAAGEPGSQTHLLETIGNVTLT